MGAIPAIFIFKSWNAFEERTQIITMETYFFVEDIFSVAIGIPSKHGTPE